MQHNFSHIYWWPKAFILALGWKSNNNKSTNMHLGYAPENFSSELHMQRVGYHKIFNIFRQTEQQIQNKLD